MNTRRWIDPAPAHPPEILRQAVGGHPLIAETLMRRGVTELSAALAFLNPDRYTPASPFDLPDMQAAVERVERAIKAGDPLAVWGDFDVDGQTATSLLVESLRKLGADVRYYIPHREREGHGIHIPALDHLIDDGAKLIVTCDTGISAHEALDHARSRGVDVVVTDHHALPESLPTAAALVNPKRMSDPEHPLWTLPGVAVAYKLIEALFTRAGKADQLPPLLDLVAMGIVADVAEQSGDARYLLQRGLAVLRSTERLGLRALIENAEIVSETLSEEHIAFQLAPRLNALGRLGDANQAVELLTTDDLERARVLAAMLEGLNAERRFLTTQITDAALAQLENDPTLREYPAIVLSGKGWHAGIVGIVASRLVETFDKPAVLLVEGEDGISRGSARSVDGVDISAAIGACSEILLGWGGHTGAAGLRLETPKVPALRRLLGEAVRKVSIGKPESGLHVDGYVTLNEITPALTAEIDRLAPFGAGNPPLTLAVRNLTVLRHGAIGRTGEHRSLTVTDSSGATARAIWWGGGDQPVPDDRFDLAFVARARNYRGKQEVQIEWRDARPAAGAISLLKPQLEVHDLRETPDVITALREIHTRHGEALQVWAEGEAAAPFREFGARNRLALENAPALAVVTAPAGYADVKAALESVKPRMVYAFAFDPQADDARAFLTRLAGLAKYAIRQRGGQADLNALAAACAQRTVAVRAGLDWLAARGEISVRYDGDTALIEAGTGAVSEPDHPKVRALLEESAVFRYYWRLMRLSNLRNLLSSK